MAPATYPMSVQKVIFFAYHIKSIFTIPITATPAADPITSKLPPVPAQYAKNSQNTLSTGKDSTPSNSVVATGLVGYIP
jgi:hypothetical protein